MAVYTKLNQKKIEEILSNYSLGKLDSFEGIEEGIENTNYFLSVKKNNSFILGGGSNILFTENYKGLILHNRIQGIQIIKQDSNFVYVKVGAGENWHEFVLHTLQQGWGGLENLSLIPGNVGTAPIQNIGAYGVEIKDIFVSCSGYFLNTIEKKKFELKWRKN